MIDQEIFRLALKSIFRNKTRTILTMLGIIIGVSAVILLVSIGQGLQKYITGQFENLGSNLVSVLPGKVSLDEGFSGGAPNFGGSKLTLKMTEDLARLGGSIETAIAAVEVPASVTYGKNSKYTSIDGVTANFGKVRNLTVNMGREVTGVDVALSRNVAVIGKSIAEKLFGATSPVGKTVNIGTRKFEVVGVLDPVGSGGFGIDINNFVAIPITSAQKMFGLNSVQVISVKAKSKEEIPQAIAQTKKYLAKFLKDDEFSVIDQSNLVSTINQILGVLTVALGGIAAISLVVGGVGIMNIMLVSVTERTKEIGLRKAVGAKPSDIRNQFVIEAVVLSTSGGVIGIILGWLGSWALSRFINTSVSLWSVVLAFGVSVLVGIIFGVAPAVRASRLDPITALRYE
ncbi:hypothetical protein A2188_03100 [Candidatus Woesebacteria bacterium RIFOXYA1_FULL_43_9]|uniref:Multidrug ABC transporter substrate-binding protein n=1 Tax=Candidatus Woesebacteria bacterium RIFOXYA1_FULL_43_9 TaxID=1802534 RepID=A0A1F8CKZ8_9BACT|nr:MAG: hypothetical protein A2188_03100 [Candidatus Woesebacteria bacterium RIFOXYA1_FULL_43_9]